MKKIIAIGSMLMGIVFLSGCGQQPVSQTQPVVPAPIVTQPPTQSDDANTTIDGVKIEKIDRRKGEKCATSGPDERYNNLPLANETYLYADPFKAITLEMPYNKNWKFAGCEIGPFTQFKDGDGVIVYFGQPGSWGPDQYDFRIGKARSVEEIQKELLVGPEDSLPRNQMKKITINGLDAFRWQENGMGEMIRIEIVGKKYNYRFESVVGEESELMEIIKTLNFLQSESKQPLSTQASNDSPVIVPADSQIYKNDKYGFELTLPVSWQGYNATNRTLDWGSLGKSDSIDFGLPAQPDGLFNISIHTKKQWTSIKSEGGPTPEMLGENGTYVFAWAQAQYAKDSSVGVRMKEVSSIIKTFKLTK